MEKKTWYVYLLCDPDTEQPFYVGKGKGKRMYLHGVPSDEANPEKLHTIRVIQDRGKQVLCKKVAEFNAEEDAYIYEWATINLYYDQVTNILHNGSRVRKIKKIKAKIRVCKGQPRPQEGDRVVVQEEQGAVCRKIIRIHCIHHYYTPKYLDYEVVLSQEAV